MRCPECTLRNSVAAKECRSCGVKFKKKPTPLGLKLGIGGAIIGLGVWGAAAAFVPSFTDPGNSLSRTAKIVAAGPKSADEAMKMRGELDLAVRTYLKQIGKLPTKELANKLQDELHSSAYEVNAFDLPRGIKLVEVDTVLNACDYLVLNDQATVKIVPLPGMEVFDSGKMISESGAPVLVLIGHTGGQTPRRPLIQALAVLPGDVADESAKAVPGLSCEGTAAFAANNRDILVDMSLYSAGAGQDLFKTSPNVVARTDDENVRCILKWKNGHYIIDPALGKGPLSPVMALAWGMRNPTGPRIFGEYLGDQGQAFAASNAMPKGKGLEFVVKRLPTNGRRSSRNTIAYYISGSNGSFQVDLKNDGHKWVYRGAKRLSPDQATIADQQSTIPEFKNAASQPAPIVVASTTAAPKKDAIAVAPVAEQKVVTKEQPAPVVSQQPAPIVQKTAAPVVVASAVAPVVTAPVIVKAPTAPIKVVEKPKTFNPTKVATPDPTSAKVAETKSKVVEAPKSKSTQANQQPVISNSNSTSNANSKTALTDSSKTSDRGRKNTDVVATTTRFKSDEQQDQKDHSKRHKHGHNNESADSVLTTTNSTDNNGNSNTTTKTGTALVTADSSSKRSKHGLTVDDSSKTSTTSKIQVATDKTTANSKAQMASDKTTSNSKVQVANVKTTSNSKIQVAAERPTSTSKQSAGTVELRPPIVVGKSPSSTTVAGNSTNTSTNQTNAGTQKQTAAQAATVAKLLKDSNKSIAVTPNADTKTGIHEYTVKGQTKDKAPAVSDGPIISKNDIKSTVSSASHSTTTKTAAIPTKAAGGPSTRQLEFGITTPRQHQAFEAAARGDQRVTTELATPTGKTGFVVPNNNNSKPVGKTQIASAPTSGLKTSMTLNSLGNVETAAVKPAAKSAAKTTTEPAKSKSKTGSEPAKPSPAASKETAKASQTETIEVVDADSVKVRSGPATDYKTITELPKGSKMEVLGRQNGWYKVKVNNKEGFVYGGLVNNKKNDAYTTAVVKKLDTVKDSNQKSVKTPKTGDKLVVLGGIQDGKYKVQLANGKIGYVPKDSIDVKVDAPEFVP